MTKFELKGFSPRKDQDLMPHTNAKHWFLAAQQRLRCLDPFTDSSWVARTIREKDAIWVVFENFFRWGVRWDNDDAATITCQAAQDIPLDPTIATTVRGSATVAWVVGLNPKLMWLGQTIRRRSCCNFSGEIQPMLGAAKTCSSNSASSRISVEMPPLIAPTTRILRVRARVSMPWMPGYCAV